MFRISYTMAINLAGLTRQSLIGLRYNQLYYYGNLSHQSSWTNHHQASRNCND